MRRQYYPFAILGTLITLVVLIVLGTQQSFGISIQKRERALTGSQTEIAELEKLYRAALKKGQHEVVVYQAAMDYEWQPLWQAFEQAFPGLKINYMHLSPAEVFNRLDTERVTNSHYADVISYPVNNIYDMRDNGYLDEFAPVNASRLPVYYQSPDHTIHFSFLKVFGLGFNKNRITEQRLPLDIQTLLKDEWKKKFEYGAHGGGAGTVDLAFIKLLHRHAITEADLETIKNNGGSGATQEMGTIALAQARTAVSPWVYLPPLARQKALGVPIDIVYPEDFTLLVPFGQGIVKNPANPEAAKLLITWLLTPDVQKLFAEKTYSYGTTIGAPRPEGVPVSVKNTIADPALYPEELSVQLKVWVPKFRDLWTK